MKKIKQDTPRVKVSIADLNDANRQSQRVVDMAKHYAKRAHDAEHAVTVAKRNLLIVSIALVVVSAVLAVVGVGMVLS